MVSCEYELNWEVKIWKKKYDIDDAVSLTYKSAKKVTYTTSVKIGFPFIQSISDWNDASYVTFTSVKQFTYTSVSFYTYTSVIKDTYTHPKCPH